jgi:hypothetical protein
MTDNVIPFQRPNQDDGLPEAGALADTWEAWTCFCAALKLRKCIDDHEHRALPLACEWVVRGVLVGWGFPAEAFRHEEENDDGEPEEEGAYQDLLDEAEAYCQDAAEQWGAS